uniref:Uncharacterized protein n=1 Tax=Fagus sylvatica TaxID=28930 RepID=A0A2N9ESU4_FAGSY
MAAPPARLLGFHSTATDQLPPLLDLVPRPVGEWRPECLTP